MSFNGLEQQTFSNISATTAAFTLRGGAYGLMINATWGGGTVVLSRLSQDGSTYVPVITALTADGYVSVALPGGTYKLVIATASGVYGDLTGIVTTQ